MTKGKRLQQYSASTGLKAFEGRKSIANNSKCTLMDSKGTVLVRAFGNHDQARRCARMWVQ